MTHTNLDFGPNHEAVAELLADARGFRPYRNVGKPTASDASLVRVTFEFLASHRENSEAPWEGNLATAEQAILEALRQGQRWPVEDSIQRAVFHPDPNSFSNRDVDTFLIDLDETYCDPEEGYFPGTCLYPHEIYYDFQRRIPLGAAMETALRDLMPSETFFRALVPWLKDGHLPYG